MRAMILLILLILLILRIPRIPRILRTLLRRIGFSLLAEGLDTHENGLRLLLEPIDRDAPVASAQLHIEEDEERHLQASRIRSPNP